MPAKALKTKKTENNSLTSARSPLTGKAIVSKHDDPPAKNGNNRRTQAERLAETRGRILAATTHTIDEKGLHQTSLQHVAKAADVTVGAVQHHFTNKKELLNAVVEDSFQQLTEELQRVDFEKKSLEERINLFVQQSWDFCNSPRFQASLQILLGIRNDKDENFEEWVNRNLGQVANEGIELWHRVFSDVSMSEEEHFNILLYIFSSLSGSALLHRISQMPERIESDLHELKQFLLLRFNNQS